MAAPKVKRPKASLIDLPPAEVAPEERARAREVVRRLKAEHPDARVRLNFSNPWQLLVATILAAQTTDAKVNEIAPALFAQYPDPQAMARARPAELEVIIHPLGFFRNKAKSIKAASSDIVERFGGNVPATMADMLSLPGVARKTANVVLSNALGVTSGVVVDTHNIRITGRLGFTRSPDPVKIEQFWLGAAERRDWPRVGHLLYAHGQRVCTARAPAHGRCVLRDICPSASLPAEGS